MPGGAEEDSRLHPADRSDDVTSERQEEEENHGKSVVTGTYSWLG